ncbi:WXG100 family type VII secretion target [uncultured Jatrophihabitans sp.]|uniref:WXG100 family type VII secretion target n=1 Tax=uncultured Jatrophihabitans sp. TaxID=1610747 RepID=UPI0035CC3BA1
MSYIRVTPEELDENSTAVSNGANQVNEILTQLLGQINDLASRWQGSGATAFQQLYDEWNRGAQMTHEGMQGIATFLSQAARTYEDADGTIATAAQSS